MEQFTTVKRGYDPEEVDRYVATLEQVIKSYKDKDSAIKNAIISAQIAADAMIANAQTQVRDYREALRGELERLCEEIERQRMRLRAFQDVYTNLVRKYLIEPDARDMSELYAQLDDIDSSVQRFLKGDITKIDAQRMDMATGGTQGGDVVLADFAPRPAPTPAQRLAPTPAPPAADPMLPASGLPQNPASPRPTLLGGKARQPAPEADDSF